MSCEPWCINVAGMIFRCNKCDKTITIEYAEGAHPPVLGTRVFRSRIDGSHHHDELDQTTPDPSHYLYKFGLCSACYESTVPACEIKNVEEAADRFCQLTDKRQQLIDEFVPKVAVLVDQVASEMTLGDIQSAIGHPVDFSFGDKYATQSKRLRLIHVFVQKYSTEIEKYIRRKISAEGSIRKAVKQYREEMLPLTRKVKSLLPASGTTFVYKRTNAFDNLSVRVFEASTGQTPNALHQEGYYEEFPIALDGMMLSLALSSDGLQFGLYERINKKLCNEIMVRLAMPHQAVPQ